MYSYSTCHISGAELTVQLGLSRRIAANEPLTRLDLMLAFIEAFHQAGVRDYKVHKYVMYIERKKKLSVDELGLIYEKFMSILRHSDLVDSAAESLAHTEALEHFKQMLLHPPVTTKP